MKRYGVLIALFVLLLIGGGLTTQLISSGEEGILPVLRTTDDADASVSDILPWKAEQFFLAIGFILFNLIGMGLTIALVFWFIDRGIRKSRAEAPAAPAKAGRAAPPAAAPSEPAGEAT